MIDTGLIDKELMDYYRELSPAERKLRLEAFENQDEKVTEFCRELYKRRHTDPKHPEKTVDFLLWKLAYLPGLYVKNGCLADRLKEKLRLRCRSKMWYNIVMEIRAEGQ